ncbi:30S ribosomal protein S16 [bacterium]|nr:30S ribosomal protein S16 [bacterium]
MRKQASYKIVVADARKPRDGKAVDILGSYSPQRKDKPLTLDIKKVDKWLAVGAQPTEAAKKIVDKARKAAEEQGVTKVSLTSEPGKPKPSKKQMLKQKETAEKDEKAPAEAQPETEKTEPEESETKETGE